MELLLDELSLKRKEARSPRSKGWGKQKTTMDVEDDMKAQQPEIPMTNASYGLLVGPFGLIEDKILDWSPEKRSGTCDRLHGLFGLGNSFWYSMNSQ